MFRLCMLSKLKLVNCRFIYSNISIVFLLFKLYYNSSINSIRVMLSILYPLLQKYLLSNTITYSTVLNLPFLVNTSYHTFLYSLSISSQILLNPFTFDIPNCFIFYVTFYTSYYLVYLLCYCYLYMLPACTVFYFYTHILSLAKFYLIHYLSTTLFAIPSTFNSYNITCLIFTTNNFQILLYSDNLFSFKC